MSAKFERSRFFRTCLCCQPSLADPSRRSFLGSALATVGLGAMGVTAVGLARARKPNRGVDESMCITTSFRPSTWMP